MRDIVLFSISLILISTVVLGGYNYHTTVTGQIIRDYTEKATVLNNQINTLKENYDKQLTEQQQYLNQQATALIVAQEGVEELQTKSSELKKELNSQVQVIQGTIETVKEQNEQLAQLSSQLKQVEISSVSKISDLQKQLANLDISEDFSNIIAQVLPSVVSIRAGSNVGSGAIIKSNGYVITNKHVIEGQNSITVKTFDQQTFTASLVSSANQIDLALLKINATSLPALTFANSDNIQVGEKAVALGSPLGLEFTVTEGIISSLNRVINGVKYVQTDVPINPGNSGGPLVNKLGQIIGINTMKLSGYEGIGFAISSNEVVNAVNNIVQ
ncbi:trypsin-like peptidase domain-containing protein [Candidatus Woesearchaeota archaeon]|nr:trypsin-like peptidase domain-containing protein [Candidatus Woesearchaeota archaeon]